MRRMLTATLAFTLLCGTALAAPGDRYQGPGDNRGQYPNNQAPAVQDQNDGDQDRGGDHRRWSHGDRIPDQYRDRRYIVSNWRDYGLQRPPRGYQWVRNDNNDFFLALTTNGTISQTVYRSDRDQRWNQRYQRSYTYNDDLYYQQCRNQPDPAGVLAGGFIGALLGRAAGSNNNRTETTIAGVIIGAAVGANLTKNMDCEDRSYAYKSYYDGFNSGRPNSSYRWSNPRDGHRGQFSVGSYYNDQDGFRCANYTQTVTIQGRQQTSRGVACRQSDGTWAVIR